MSPAIHNSSDVAVGRTELPGFRSRPPGHPQRAGCEVFTRSSRTLCYPCRRLSTGYAASALSRIRDLTPGKLSGFLLCRDGRPAWAFRDRAPHAIGRETVTDPA